MERSKERTRHTHVFANVLNLNVLSNPSPFSVSIHRPPPEVKSRANVFPAVSESEPAEKRGDATEEAILGSAEDDKARTWK